MKTITVCKRRNASHYFLRLFVSSPGTGVVEFHTADEFSKREADYRTVVLSAQLGFDRDELPTHNEIEAYPIDAAGEVENGK
jgi:hypothetical protein